MPPTPIAGPPDEGRRRRDQIRQLVVTNGFVRIDTLAHELEVSAMTIHRDLQKLESDGWLRKVRGGATSRPSALFHGDVAHRAGTMAAAKRELAQAALGLIQPGQSLLVDESTTVQPLVTMLPSVAPLTVVTNSLAALSTLAQQPGIDLIGLGGTHFPAYNAFLGMQTVRAVSAMRIDVLVMSTTAVTQGRCFHQSPETVTVKRAFMESATQRVLLLDHTKFRKIGLHELAPLADFDVVLVDSGTDPGVVSSLRSMQIEVRIARSSAATAGTPTASPSA